MPPAVAAMFLAGVSAGLPAVPGRAKRTGTAAGVLLCPRKGRSVQTPDRDAGIGAVPAESGSCSGTVWVLLS